jgi:outer membrane usher protein
VSRAGGVALPALSALVVLAGPCGALRAQAQPAADTARTAQVAPAAHAAPAVPRPQPLEVIINHTTMGTWTLLEVSGALYADPEALRAWRILMPGGTPPVVFRERVWHPLFVLPGYRAQFDASAQAVLLTLDPAAFVGTQLGQEPGRALRPAPPLPALAVNYELAHTQIHDRGTRSLQDSGLLAEILASGSWGVLTASIAGRHLAMPQADDATAWRRLQSTWTFDWPDRAWTLRAGDTATRLSIWGRSFQFGGLQLGTNFGLKPGWSGQSVPTLSGSATAPSTVELYINDTLRQTQQVGAGPFTIENLQEPAGAAEARIVVRDILGRETVIVRPFFTSTRLLRTGVSEWSVEAGRLRHNPGAARSDYRQVFVQGWVRHGWDARWTTESAAQASRDLRHLSLGVTGTLAESVLVQAALAGSDSATAGRGGSALLGLERSTAAWSLGLRTVVASAGFRELGRGGADLPARAEHSATLRHVWPSRWSLGLTLARRETHDAGALTSGTASLGWTSPSGLTWLAHLTRVQGPQLSRSAQVSVIWPLDGRRVLSAQVGRSASTLDASASVSSPIQAGSGLGWRALAGRRAAAAVAEAGAYWQADRWLGAVEVRSGSGSHAWRAGLQGALVAVDGSVFAANSLQDSFALVEVPGQPGVVVGLGSGAGVRTDARGRALLPRLLAYQENAVRIDPDALPEGAELDEFERAAVPPWRSGVRVVFAVRQGRAALVHIVLDDGLPAPALAEVSLEGDERRFTVAHRGEAYVTGLSEGESTLHLHWRGQSCAVALQVPAAAAAEVLRVGPLPCPGVRR